MSVAHLLVVDDEPDIREVVKELLEDEGYVVTVAADGESARKLRLERRPDLILLDVWMPDIDGITLLKEWQEASDTMPPVIVMSGHGTVETAVEATRLGAYDFLEKPLSMAKLLLTIRHALEQSSLRRENIGLRRHARPILQPLGKSAAMQQLRGQVEKVAHTEAPVLLLGEPGVGKRQFARYLHENSPHSTGAFIEVGVASIGSANGMRQLLGEEKGERVTYGSLEQANGGTLFLNEIGELDLELQGRLASALQKKAIVRLGGVSEVPIHVRLVASTRFDLAEQMRLGRFREDLYYQLNVVPITVLPLRERRDDILELLAWYIDYFVQEEALNYRRISMAAQNRLRHYDWPGNVRELKNLVQRLLIMGNQEEISVDEVDRALGKQPMQEGAMPIAFDLPLRQAREQFERAYFEYHLDKSSGNMTQLAKHAGIERTHLYRKIKALGITVRSDDD